MNETSNVQNLLTTISDITKQYEKIAELTGENFNIFRVLKLETREVRAHSAFLAELMNPKGNHGQKEIFLKLFIDQLQIDDFDFDWEHATVETNKSIGFISEDKNEGGYLDIFINDKNNHAVIIENKIYFGDLETQLLRYHNFGKKQFPDKFRLLYLTLNGRDASDESKGDLKKDKDYQTISYRKDILEWL